MTDRSGRYAQRITDTTTSVHIAYNITLGDLVSANRTVGQTRPIKGAAAALLPVIGLAAGVGIAARGNPFLLSAACLVLLVAALPLSVIDVTTRKLPDRILLPAIPACIVLLALAAVRAGYHGPIWRALAAGAVVFVAFTVLAVTVPGQLGFGDCKAAALCALPLGYLGWSQVLSGVVGAYVFAALYIISCRLLGKATERTFAFGPFLFAGALTVLLAG